MHNPLDDLTFSGPFNTWWPFLFAALVGIITTIRSYCGGPHCPSKATICGKVVVITGGSSGIGCQVVKELLRRGGKVIVGSRNPKEAEEAIKKAIGKDPKKTQLFIKHLELTSLKSVRQFVESLECEPQIDILINNAGIAFHEFKKTEEGFETHFVINYLSHFLLTHLLLPKLKAAEDARIINVSAQAHYAGHLALDDLNSELDYSYNKAFSQSKLALVLMARHMKKILEDTNVTINAMHPGLVKSTKQFKKSPFCASIPIKISLSPWIWLFMKTPEQGAQTIIYMAVANELKNVSGKYFSNCKMIEPSEKALDDVAAEKLYLKSLKLTKIFLE